jgi:porin
MGLFDRISQIAGWIARTAAALSLSITLAVAAETPQPVPPAEQPPENPATGSNAAEPAQEKEPNYSKNMLGDIGGLRPAIATYGFDFSASETSEVLANVSGGLKRGAIYEGLTDLSLTWDLRKPYGWPGVFYARGLQIHGRGLTANNLGNLITSSSIEAERSTRLFELWYEHYVADWLRLKIGQQAADQEFIVSATSKLFINATFGFPTLPAANLPSGGPAYPLGTPAVRLRLEPTADLVLLAAAFNGDPAGPGAGTAQSRDRSGTGFRTGDGVLAFLEAQYNPGHTPQNGTYKLGAWFNSLRFADQRFDASGVSLADPASTGSPRLLGNDYSIYAVADQPVAVDAEGKGLTGFLRVMGAPSDRNLISFYFDTGLAYKGPFGRDDDTVGIGFAFARIGDNARRLDADTAAFTGTNYPVRSAEALVEVSYQAQVTPWWQLQPDFQYVINPGGGIPNQKAPAQKIRDAAIFGLRTTISF